MAEVLRDIDTEAELQNALNRGDRVWVIGDVHGHSDALENLITELDPNPGDRIVLMGDLIDRGPDSRMVIRIAKERADTFVIRGNHEDWALNGFEQNGAKTWAPSLDWLMAGGKQCLDSYSNSDSELNTEDWSRDLEWMMSMPHCLILDDWVLVHAGLEPSVPLESQTPRQMMWIRDEFHDATEPVDPNRSVVFGHSITHVVLGKEIGEVATSYTKLEDGRPLWFGIDTGACDSKSGWLTAMDLGSGELVQAKDDGESRRLASILKQMSRSQT